MNKKHQIKDKVNGKWFTFGNVTPGEKGPKMGLRVSPELRQLIAGKKDGEWVNFLLFEDDGQKPLKKNFAGDDSGFGEEPF